MTDTSFWTKLNPKVERERTRKAYFGKYYCKLVVNCPGGKLIDTEYDDMYYALRERVQNQRGYNYGGSWWHAEKAAELAKADVRQLSLLKEIKQKTDNIKVRVEEPWVQIYTENEDELKLVAVRFPDELKHTIQSVYVPADEQDLERLKVGKILLPANSKIAHKYKIVLKDGTYQSIVKQQVLSYLESLGEEIRMSKGSKAMLERPFNYLWGVYFYINDLKIITFLNLIAPDIVSRIHEMEKVE